MRARTNRNCGGIIRYKSKHFGFDHITHISRNDLTNIVRNNRIEDIISWIFSPFPSSESIFVCIQVHVHRMDVHLARTYTLFPHIDCECNCNCPPNQQHSRLLTPLNPQRQTITGPSHCVL